MDNIESSSQQPAQAISANWIAKCCALVVAACCALIAIEVAARASGNAPFATVWDDSYMWVRYADNILQSGKIAWNPRGEATYGLTSLAYTIVVLPMRLLFGNNPTLAVISSSILCGVAFLALLWRLLNRFISDSQTVRWVAVALVFVSLAVAREALAKHFLTGMDTMFALAFITSYILLAKREESAPSSTRAVTMGIWGGLAFLVRPDLLLYTTVVPFATIVLSSDRQVKRNGVIALGVTACVFGLEMLLATLYFGSPLPLPFYAKAMSYYKDFGGEAVQLLPARELLRYVSSYPLLFGLIVLALVVNFRAWLRNFSAVEKGLLVATTLFLVYYWFFVLQIMGYDQRFYYPTLPAIAFLAAKSLAHIWKHAPISARQPVRNAPVLAWSVATLLLLIFLAQSARTAPNQLRAIKHRRFGFDFSTARRSSVRLDSWPRLNQFSALPDDLVIACADIGLPSVMNPRKRIVDLAGLNDTTFARRGFSADVLLNDYRPDLIYMPHRFYGGMLRDISSHPDFARRYKLFSAEELNAQIQDGLALRRDSPHFARMTQIIARRNSPSKLSELHPKVPQTASAVL